MDAALLDRDGERIGSVVDLDFRPADGAILHYLIARSDPRLPGEFPMAFGSRSHP